MQIDEAIAWDSAKGETGAKSEKKKYFHAILMDLGLTR
jgi:hypothetical protein